MGAFDFEFKGLKHSEKWSHVVTPSRAPPEELYNFCEGENFNSWVRVRIGCNYKFSFFVRELLVESYINTTSRQIWTEIITSRHAQSACLKGSRTSCDVLVFGVYWASFGRKDYFTWWMLPADGSRLEPPKPSGPEETSWRLETKLPRDNFCLSIVPQLPSLRG